MAYTPIYIPHSHIWNPLLTQGIVIFIGMGNVPGQHYPLSQQFITSSTCYPIQPNNLQIFLRLRFNYVMSYL